MEFNHFLSSYLPDRAYGGKRLLDRLAAYDEAGIDDVIVSSNLGQSQRDSLEAMQRLAEEVMPHFTRRSQSGLPQASGVV